MRLVKTATTWVAIGQRGFTTVSIAAAQDALSDVGLSTKVTVPVGGDLRFDEAEVGSVFIDCTAETRFCRGYPKSFDAISDATWIKRKLVLWLDWPVRPGVVSAENGVTLTNAGRARIRLCRDSEQYWKIHQSPLVDLGAPTMYVFTESGLSNAVRVIGRELTMGSVRRRLRGFGEAAGALAIAVFVSSAVPGSCLVSWCRGVRARCPNGHVVKRYASWEVGRSGPRCPCGSPGRATRSPQWRGGGLSEKHLGCSR